MATFTYLSCFFINCVPDGPKLTNSDSAVGFPVLFCIQGPVGCHKNESVAGAFGVIRPESTHICTKKKRRTSGMPKPVLVHLFKPITGESQRRR